MWVDVLIGKEHQRKLCVNEFQNITHFPEMKLCRNVLIEVTSSGRGPTITTLLNRNGPQRTWKAMHFLGSNGLEKGKERPHTLVLTRCPHFNSNYEITATK